MPNYDFQPTASELAEAAKSMIPSDGGDMYRTIERLRREKSLQHSKKSPPAPEWSIEPTELEILQEVQLTGGNYADCKAALTAKLSKTARGLKEITPDAIAKIQAAKDAASDAMSNAESVYSESLQAIESVQQLVLSLGRVRLKAFQLTGLVLTPDAEISAGERILAAYLENQGPSSSSQTNAEYRGLLHDLSVRKLLSPFIKPQLQKCETEAMSYVQEIKSSATAAGIKLYPLLKQMMSDTARWPEILKYNNAAAFNDLYS